MDDENSIIYQTYGAYVGGNMNANSINIHVNQPATSSHSPSLSKSFFRYNIPTPTRHFTGRKDKIEAVRNYFITLPPQPIDCWERIVAIVGLGGMGKTEAAYKFAAELKETFPNVALINAETERSALESFLGLAKHLKIIKNDRKEADLDLVKQVYHHLDEQDYGRVLFILDNAVRLHSDEEEFGIMEYLPSDDLPNQRFPYVLITSQTHDWERRIETFQVDELSEVESLEFFRSCFAIQSAECDDRFKKLHKLLDGCPLVMNLAASQLDYIPKKHSVHQLNQQIQNYIDKIEKENNKILHDKFNRAWPTKYHKTLSNVWQLTFERIQQEEKGSDALELLQFMSFLHVPIWSQDVVDMLVRSSDCPHPSTKELDHGLKESARLLEKFYTVRMLKVYDDNEQVFSCDFGIHRLVQFVVRQQMESSELIERVLFYCARDYEFQKFVNKSAVEETLRRIELSQRVLPYLGILACHGVPAAREIVEIRQPERRAAIVIWRLYYLERGMTTLDENDTQVLRELIELTKSEKRLADRIFFADIAICLLSYRKYCAHTRNNGTGAPGYLNLKSLDGIEELVSQLISHVYSVQDFSCKSSHCERGKENRDCLLSCLTVKLSKAYIREDTPNSLFTVDVIADAWFALLSRLEGYDPKERKHRPKFLCWFLDDTYKEFDSPNASTSRIGALKTCLWNRGLARKLTQVFKFQSHDLSPTDGYITPWVMQMMGGVELRGEHVQEVISSICQMARTIETKFLSKYHQTVLSHWRAFAVDLCSFWVRLFLMHDDPPSHEFLDSLSSQSKFLDWIERSPKLDNRNEVFFGWSFKHIPNEYPSQHFPKFIKRFSSSDIKPIKTLVNVSQRLMEDYKMYRWIEKYEV